MSDIFRLVLFISFIAALAPAFAYAQGGDGRPETSFKKPSNLRGFARPKIKRSKMTAIRVLQPAKPPVPDLGILSAVINESDSRVYLSSPTSSETPLVFVTPRRQSAFWRMLPPGRYALTVKKPGFFDEVRTVDIEARARRRLTVNLRPQMAILNVSTNLTDAEIDIENVGKFSGVLKKHFLKPGRYRVSLKRRGFVSQILTADLTIAGKEQQIYAVLQPLRVDSVLAQANELFVSGRLDEATLLVKDVLAMNPAHARANLLCGFIEFRRGIPSAAGYFLKAIRGGETVSIPARTVVANNLTDIEIALNRNAIAFRSAQRVDLNFQITRTNLDEMQSLMDANSSTYIAVKGASDFFGRGIRPNLKIYSGAAEIDRLSKQVVCSGMANGRSCATDVSILFDTISRWRELPGFSENRRSR